MFKRLSAALIGSILFCIISISSGGISASKNSVQSISSNNGKTMIACNIQKIDNRDKYIESLSKDDLETQRRLNQYMDAAANNNNFHGEVLVEKGSKILLSKGYGMADYEKSIPNTSSTKLAIGSITKQFTSMAVMQLYEKGKLKLTDKLNKFFKDFPRGNEISIHQLLSHTSGIVNYTQLEEFYKLAPEDLKSDNIIKLLYNKPLDFEPGQSWNYSNSNYLLLSKIIEKLSGMSLEEYMEKNIFKPLDMKNTGACFSKGKIRLSAKGYTGYLDVKPADDTMTFKAATGDGFLFSTVEDLYKWDRALYTDKLVSKKTMDLIFTPYAHTFMGEYGYGWYVKGDGKDKLVFHDGITAGFHSNISRYIGRNEGVIILSNNNMGGSGVYKIDNDINSILQGKEVELPKPKKAVKLEESEIQNIVGMYEIMHGTDILITRDGEHIYAQLTGAEKVEIFSEGNNEFFSRVVDSTITIIKNSSGEAVSLVAHQNGSDYYAIKQ